MKTDKYFDRLTEIKNKYPELTFNNDGYEYLRKEVKEAHKEQIAEIEGILKETIAGFVRFDNFKPRKDGSFSVRCQYNWDHANGGYFTGVGYFEIDEFKQFELTDQKQ